MERPGEAEIFALCEPSEPYRITYTSAAWVDFFGYQPEEACGRTLSQLIHGPLTEPHTSAAMIAAMQRCCTSNSEIFRTRITTYSRDGIVSENSVEVSSLTAEDGEVGGLLVHTHASGSFITSFTSPSPCLQRTEHPQPHPPTHAFLAALQDSENGMGLTGRSDSRSDSPSSPCLPLAFRLAGAADPLADKPPRCQGPKLLPQLFNDHDYADRPAAPPRLRRPARNDIDDELSTTHPDDKSCATRDTRTRTRSGSFCEPHDAPALPSPAVAKGGNKGDTKGETRTTSLLHSSLESSLVSSGSSSAAAIQRVADAKGAAGSRIASLEGDVMITVCTPALDFPRLCGLLTPRASPEPLSLRARPRRISTTDRRSSTTTYQIRSTDDG